MIPYIIFQLIFFFYNNFVLNNRIYYAQNFDRLFVNEEERMLRGKGKAKTAGIFSHTETPDYPYDSNSWQAKVLSKFEWVYHPYVYFITMAVLALFALYFLYVSILTIFRSNLRKMGVFDLFLGIGTFLFPGIFVLAFLGRQIRYKLDSIPAGPLEFPDPHLLSFASFFLWCNLLYFARMYESTGLYVIMFRSFGSTMNYIVLVVVFMLIGSDFFRIVGGSNTKVNPDT